MKTSREKALFVLRYFLFFLIGLCYIFYSCITSLNKTKEQAIQLARIVEAGLHSEEIEMLEGSAKDLVKKEYMELKTNLTSIVVINNNIRFAYIYSKMIRYTFWWILL